MTKMGKIAKITKMTLEEFTRNLKPYSTGTYHVDDHLIFVLGDTVISTMVAGSSKKVCKNQAFKFWIRFARENKKNIKKLLL